MIQNSCNKTTTKFITQICMTSNNEDERNQKDEHNQLPFMVCIYWARTYFPNNSQFLICCYQKVEYPTQTPKLEYDVNL